MLRTPAFVALMAAAACTQAITVSPNIQVSKALPNDAHFEMQIAADPAHPERLMACSMLWPADWIRTEVVTYTSLDGGRTWTPALRVRGEDRRESWDPACTYGPDGIAYTVSENVGKSGSFDSM